MHWNKKLFYMNSDNKVWYDFTNKKVCISGSPYIRNAVLYVQIFVTTRSALLNSNQLHKMKIETITLLFMVDLRHQKGNIELNIDCFLSILNLKCFYVSFYVLNF